VEGSGNWGHVVRVIDPADLPGRPKLLLNANALKQRVVCYLQREPVPPPACPG
jgi:hypothetical protein